jgi:hypothetical protein
MTKRGGASPEGENPKKQILNPKQYRSPKYELPKQFRDLNFDVWICLELRA